MIDFFVVVVFVCCGVTAGRCSAAAAAELFVRVFVVVSDADADADADDSRETRLKLL